MTASFTVDRSRSAPPGMAPLVPREVRRFSVALPRRRSPVRTRCSAPINASAFLANFERAEALLFSIWTLVGPCATGSVFGGGPQTTRKSASGLAARFAAMLTSAL